MNMLFLQHQHFKSLKGLAENQPVREAAVRVEPKGKLNDGFLG